MVSATRVTEDGLFDWGRGSNLWGGPLRMAQAIAAFVDEQQILVARLSQLLEARDWSEDIPLEGRIVAIADVFDALTSVRPYKQAWPVDDAVGFLREQSGRHFDPRLVELFIACLPEILQIKERWAEQPAA